MFLSNTIYQYKYLAFPMVKSVPKNEELDK
jgi:hypothetical protein